MRKNLRRKEKYTYVEIEIEGKISNNTRKICQI